MLLTNASHHYPSIGWAVCKAHLISASPLQQSLETSDFTARPHHIYVSESTSRVPYVTPKGDNEPKLSTQTLPLLVQKPCLNPSSHSPGQRQARSLSALNRCSTERLSNLPGPKELENARCALKAQHVLSHV